MSRYPATTLIANFADNPRDPRGTSNCGHPLLHGQVPGVGPQCFSEPFRLNRTSAAPAPKSSSLVMLAAFNYTGNAEILPVAAFSRNALNLGATRFAC